MSSFSSVHQGMLEIREGKELEKTVKQHLVESCSHKLEESQAGSVIQTLL